MSSHRRHLVLILILGVGVVRGYLVLKAKAGGVKSIDPPLTDRACRSVLGAEPNPVDRGAVLGSDGYHR